MKSGTFLQSKGFEDLSHMVPLASKSDGFVGSGVFKKKKKRCLQCRSVKGWPTGNHKFYLLVTISGLV